MGSVCEVQMKQKSCGFKGLVISDMVKTAFYLDIFFLVSYFSRMEENPKVGESLLSKVLFLVCPPISCHYF